MLIINKGLHALSVCHQTFINLFWIMCIIFSDAGLLQLIYRNKPDIRLMVQTMTLRQQSHMTAGVPLPAHVLAIVPNFPKSIRYHSVFYCRWHMRHPTSETRKKKKVNLTFSQDESYPPPSVQVCSFLLIKCSFKSRLTSWTCINLKWMIYVTREDLEVYVTC